MRFNDSISGNAATGLDDEAFALDATQAEESIAKFTAQVAELEEKAQAANIETTTFADRAAQYEAEAVAIEGGMAETMRAGGDVDKAANRAALARSKGRAALQAAQLARAEKNKFDFALQGRYVALQAAERGRAGIVFNAKAQEFARSISALRPAVDELRELAILSGREWSEGRGLVPNFAVPEVAGIRFDI